MPLDSFNEELDFVNKNGNNFEIKNSHGNFLTLGKMTENNMYELNWSNGKKSLPLKFYIEKDKFLLTKHNNFVFSVSYLKNKGAFIGPFKNGLYQIILMDNKQINNKIPTPKVREKKSLSTPIKIDDRNAMGEDYDVERQREAMKRFRRNNSPPSRVASPPRRVPSPPRRERAVASPPRRGRAASPERRIEMDDIDIEEQERILKMCRRNNNNDDNDDDLQECLKLIAEMEHAEREEEQKNNNIEIENQNREYYEAEQIDRLKFEREEREREEREKEMEEERERKEKEEDKIKNMTAKERQQYIREQRLRTLNQK